MKVLHLSSGQMFGGIETLLVTLARYRDCAPRMVPHFAFAFEGRVAAELRTLGVPVHILGPVRASRPWSVLSARRKLARLLRGGRFDVAVTHDCWPHAVFAPAVLRQSVPLVFWLHGTVSGLHWIERWAKRSAPGSAICNSSFTAKGFERLFPGHKFEIVYYPVAGRSETSEAPAASLRRELGVAPGAVLIVQVSRLQAWKGHALLIRALAMLPEEHEWLCVFVGQPHSDEEEQYRAGLERESRTLGIHGKVRFLTDGKNVPAALAAADLFCQPNANPEPFGIVFVEAMLAGLPVVSFRMGGAAEILDESCALLREPGDVQGLSEAIASLVADRGLRSQLGQAGQRRAQKMFAPSNQLPAVAAAIQAQL